MEIWLATGNSGKRQEIERLLDLPGLQFHQQSELQAFTPLPEDGKDFFENAKIKVKGLAAVKKDCWIVAEDSGLEVTGLAGMPGIHSARYAGNNASDAENTAKLLRMMKIRCNLQRQAQFRCAMVAQSPKGEHLQFEGIITGQIANAQRGQTGFGYDNVFIPEGQEKTFAELGIAYKLSHSHRSQAFKKFKEELKNRI